MFIGEYGKSTWLSYLGVTLSLLAICLLWQDQQNLALILFVGAGLCDLFDGVIARRMVRTQAEKDFGFELDSLCDMVSFAVFPSIYLLWAEGIFVLRFIVATFYVVAAINRLAYFNRQSRVKDQETRLSYFTGLPVTYSALILPVARLFTVDLPSNHEVFINTGLIFLMAILFISNISISKPNKFGYVLLTILAILTIMGLGLSQ